MRGAVRDNVLILSLGGMVLLAWVALFWLEASPWGSLFHSHGGGHQHHGMQAASGPGGAVLLVIGWVLMIVAMMLPTTLPLIAIYQRLVRTRPDAAMLTALLVLGYLVAWIAFGGLVYLASLAVRAGSLGHVATSGWAISAGLFIVAGAFQFSSLKYRCLDRCRSPLHFVLSRWRGHRPRLEATSLGVAHGAYCVGCCWALMLLMFAVSTANLLWMLALGLLMAIEKNVSWGRRFAKPLGVALIAIGAGSVGYHLTVAGGP